MNGWIKWKNIAQLLCETTFPSWCAVCRDGIMIKLAAMFHSFEMLIEIVAYNLGYKFEPANMWEHESRPYSLICMKVVQI